MFFFPGIESGSQLAVAAAISIVPLYLAAKAVREIVYTLYPSFIPGESNTVLLAAPRPKHLDAPSTLEDLQGVTGYDYVIVGGGTASCVLASRLSEDAGVTVLVVEAGQSDLTHLMSRIPVGNGQLLNSRVANWDYETESEAQMNGRKIGGSSSINLLVYNRGSPDDFEELQRLGNEGWGYDTMQKYMRKAEAFTPSDTHPQTDEELAQHGYTGPWQIGYSYTTKMSRALVRPCFITTPAAKEATLS
ncbi:hypothetical protein B0A55_10488 [Friedmanniomyces simplex]|uniref:Glucose-methanol-choline oxidoreductase N-terminal domain-containing protein n=1 Tax=Friedmanniomyces simplex TaxID=329884 RepID=A0A4U0WQD9_9PEZI|nr:hypothetical protein B0A55_10488 [Friedmanniomyces simplex]